MDQKRLEALLEEAIVDCYDEEEQFTGVLITLDENLQFPLQAKVLGQVVEVIGLVQARSSLRRGILATVRAGDQESRFPLSELEFIDPAPTSAEWLAMYRYWLGEAD
jgi:Calcium binding